MADKLPQQLKALQHEVKTIDAANEEKEEALLALSGQIEKALIEPEAEHHHTLIERLEEAVVLFGSDHPDLAEMINATLTILANTGV